MTKINIRTISTWVAMAALALSSASCIMSKVTPVNLNDYHFDKTKLNPKTCFIPSGVMQYDQLSDDDINAMLLPDGGTVKEALAAAEAEDTKTTSTNMTALMKGIFSMWKCAEIVSYAGTYYSVDQYGDSVLLSGRIILPAKGKISRIMIVNHFTIGANAEAPSQSLPLECIYASRGIAVIEPDYLGYGASRNHKHPYLCSQLTARNVMDMYWASLPFLKGKDGLNLNIENDDIFIWGFSQGGAVAMSLLKYIQNPPKSDPRAADYSNLSVRLTMCGSGPYDICATYDTIIANDYSDYPCAIPMIIQGMKEGMKLDELDMADFIKKMEVVDWMNSKDYTMQQITAMLGSKYIHDVMTEKAMNKANETMTDLYRVMMENSLIQGWLPYRPIYLFHSIDDNVVPYVNAMNFQAQFIGISNVQYNFGHYGNHVLSCLRFMYATVNLMYEHGDIPYDVIK